MTDAATPSRPPLIPVTVEQCDRQRMVLYEQLSAIPLAPSFAREVLEGKWDEDRRVQAFARHRIASTPTSEEVERLRAFREGFRQARYFFDPSGDIRESTPEEEDYVAAFAKREGK